jgi:hypothetical protein
MPTRHGNFTAGASRAAAVVRRFYLITAGRRARKIIQNIRTHTARAAAADRYPVVMLKFANKRLKRSHPSAGIESLESRTLLSGLTIVPTFAANIRHDPRAVQIEAAINAGIAQIDSLFSNPITVPILFEEGGGLGTSYSGYGTITYAQWRSTMVTNATDTNQKSAVASLPETNTLNGSDNVYINYANELALGLQDDYPASFGTISINAAACNLTRTSINPNKYDLQDLAMHEMDEVLGIGSVLDEVRRNGGPVPTDGIDPEDFFRYSADGTRDFTTDADAAVFFSDDGGKTDLAQFNQDAGGDFNDWYSVNGGEVPQVQDAFGTPGVVSYYSVEPTVLDVLGYTPKHALGTGIVAGNVFNDADGDGVQDGTEADVSGWTVEAVQNGKVVETAQSNALQYQLGSLADGTYTIEVVPQAGYVQTTPTADYSVTIAGHNQTVSDENFGEMPEPIGPVAGTVYNDVSGNGTLDGNQLPLAAAKVTLVEDTNGNGKVDKKDKTIGVITTGPDGTYSFPGLLAGNYFITEAVPKGYVRTSPFSSSTITLDVTAGETPPAQDFENFHKVAVAAVKKVSYAVGATAVKNLRGHAQNGDMVSVTFTVTHTGGETLSFVSYQTSRPSFSNTTAATDVEYDSATNFFLPGTYTLDVRVPVSGDYQIDFAAGSPITQFGPVGSGVFYNTQGRLIMQFNG